MASLWNALTRWKRPETSSNVIDNNRPEHPTRALEGSLPSPPVDDGVKPLHECRDPTVDICFVHGLTGDRDSTWTAYQQSTPWPKTLLPLEIKRARILTYGYDAYIVRKTVAGSNRLIDHATNLLIDLANDRRQNSASSRPLIFVAHSLGGLVCKKAILLSRNNPDSHLCGIFDCTKGIAFMGTPHKGSWMAEWAKVPAKALGLVKSTNKSLLEILEPNDQLIEAIQRDFLSMIRALRESGRLLRESGRSLRESGWPIEVTCFFEELPWPIVGEVVVSKDSATFESYNPVGIHANHSDMTKFSSADETGFKRLVGELLRWESELSKRDTFPVEKCHAAGIRSSRNRSNYNATRRAERKWDEIYETRRQNGSCLNCGGSEHREGYCYYDGEPCGKCFGRDHTATRCCNPVHCYYCKEAGHIKEDCPHK